MPEKTLYEFGIELPEFHEPTEALENAVFEVGCDDATLTFQDGECYLMFSREAEDFTTAFSSAVKDVQKIRSILGDSQ